RYGFQPVGAVVEREGLKKTSSLGRWALAADFAALFICSDTEFPNQVETWREKHLTPGARARLAVVQRGLVASAVAAGVLVEYPNKRTRHLSPGESSVIAKHVIEQFAPRFLKNPGVIWVSETSRRDEAADLELARLVGLDIEVEELLPDVILVDLGPPEPLFVFVEIVSSDGALTEDRKTALTELLARGGHNPENAAFVTALMDRSSSVFRRQVASQAAWNSFVWFASEPSKIILHQNLEQGPIPLSVLLHREES
ncbi:MAG: BsuBI/PstI family type II restriction endonuclease, partial [Candidatus Binatia bacterium]